MAGREAVKAGCKIGRPVLSADYCEAHKRVMGLYRAYFRYIPYLLKCLDIPKTERDCKMKLREYFYRNACVTDLRVIDILVIKAWGKGVCFHHSAPAANLTCPWCPLLVDERGSGDRLMAGFMNLKEITHQWQQKGHLMAHWHPTMEPKRCDFIGKFLANED